MAQFDLFDPQLASKGVATLLKTPLLENERVDFVSYVRQVPAKPTRMRGIIP